MTPKLLLATALTATATIALGAPHAVEARDDTPWRFPERPERCTDEQAESGDVGDCLLSFWGDPADSGWGSPPEPGIGEGWNWLGYTYNGSPALAEWEATYIASNTEPVGSMPADYYEFHTAAQMLFEGFLDEIETEGYEIRHASGYSFRCTSGNGGWSCPSGDPHDLSLHAWGLAVDMNSDLNPIRSYQAPEGGSACEVPMETDMPRWVIRTAEKWGLYWGGYGWSSGCVDRESDRSAVFRDPPHFEFRGTPEHAAAIAEFNLRNDPDVVCRTVIDDEGAEQERCSRDRRPGAGWRLPVDVEAPTGTEAVIVNLAVTEPASPGYVTLEDCAPRRGPRSTAALTFTAGQTVGTMAVVPLSDADRFCVYSGAATHRVVDVLAFLSGDGEPLLFEPSTPTRLTDTRDQGSCNPLQECHDGPVRDRAEHLVPTEDPAPRIANIAVTDGDAPGYLQAGGCGALGPDRRFANLNYAGDDVRSNLALVQGNDIGTCVFALSQAHVIVDELGRLDGEKGLAWDLAPSGRALDTRECSDAWCDGRPTGGTVIRVPLDTDAPAVAVAITATGSDRRGYVWAGPCSYLEGRDRPETANLNHEPGQTVTNLALVDLEDGELCLFNRSDTHIVVDVQAELTDDGTVGVIPTEPTRIHDSRDG